jgi:hypothetical protein
LRKRVLHRYHVGRGQGRGGPDLFAGHFVEAGRTSGVVAAANGSEEQGGGQGHIATADSRGLRVRGMKEDHGKGGTSGPTPLQTIKQWYAARPRLVDDPLCGAHTLLIPPYSES